MTWVLTRGNLLAPFTPPKAKRERIMAMKSNLNVDIKFYADKVLDILSNSLSKNTDKKIAGNDSVSSRGRRQRSRISKDGYGLGAQCRGGRKNRR